MTDKTINEILKKCSISNNVVTLPDIQLDRKTYSEVAKKLELIGGKWNRKNKKETAFREFLNEKNAEIINIEAGRFKDSGTMVASCIVVMNV